MSRYKSWGSRQASVNTKLQVTSDPYLIVSISLVNVSWPWGRILDSCLRSIAEITWSNASWLAYDSTNIVWSTKLKDVTVVSLLHSNLGCPSSSSSSFILWTKLVVKELNPSLSVTNLPSMECLNGLSSTYFSNSGSLTQSRYLWSMYCADISWAAPQKTIFSTGAIFSFINCFKSVSEYGYN